MLKGRLVDVARRALLHGVQLHEAVALSASPADASQTKAGLSTI
jgi:hypothetical protein